MSEEMIKITFVCRMCFYEETVEKPKGLVMFLGINPDQKGKAHFYICNDCKNTYGGFFK